MAYAASAFQTSAFKMGSPLVTLEGVLDCPGLALKKDFIDTTSISDSAESSIADPLVKHDAFDITLAYDKDNTQHMALVAAYTGGTSIFGQVVMADGETFNGSFLVIGWAPTGAKGQLSQRKVTLKPTGAISIG
jgi:hypothetical protein